VVDTNGKHPPKKPDSRPGPSPKPGPNPRDRYVLEKALHDLAGFSEDLLPYMQRVQAEYAAALVGPNPTGVEDALAQVAAINWHLMRIFEAMFCQGSNTARGQTIREAEAMQRMINHAHRRLLSTLRTLAVIRRLDIAQVQINIAGQQVVGDAHCGPGRENRPGNGR
jgi:hypothetical protein